MRGKMLFSLVWIKRENRGEGENREEIPWIHKFSPPWFRAEKKKGEKGSQILNYALTLRKTFESRPGSNRVIAVLCHPQNFMLIYLPSTSLSMSTSLPTKSHCNLLPYVVNILCVPWLSDPWIDDERVLIYFTLFYVRQCVYSRGTTTHIFHYFIFLSN